MILSHSRKFVFIKSRKTGGTSVEIALSRFVGPDDVVTPITPRDELVRMETGTPCQNYTRSKDIEQKYLTDLKSGKITYLPKWLQDQQIFVNHMTYTDLKKHFPDELQVYHTLSIERHPYEKAVSWANFQIGYKDYVSDRELAATTEDIRDKVSELIENGKIREKIRNWDVYTDKDEMRVDTVLRYDNLQADFDVFCKQIGVADKRTGLPKTKVGHRDRTLTAHQILDDDQKVAIQEICTKEFEYFQYEL